MIRGRPIGRHVVQAFTADTCMFRENLIFDSMLVWNAPQRRRRFCQWCELVRSHFDQSTSELVVFLKCIVTDLMAPDENSKKNVCRTWRAEDQQTAFETKQTRVQDRVAAALDVGVSTIHTHLAEVLGEVLTQFTMAWAVRLFPKHGQQCGIFDMDSSRVFMADSFGTGATYGMRGGHPYYIPSGWVRFAYHTLNFDKFSHCAVAYHGTSRGRIIKILRQGLLRPGEKGVHQEHGHAAAWLARPRVLLDSFAFQ